MTHLHLAQGLRSAPLHSSHGEKQIVNPRLTQMDMTWRQLFKENLAKNFAMIQLCFTTIQYVFHMWLLFTDRNLCIEDKVFYYSTQPDEVDQHPEKRMKAAYKKYEETNLPILKQENPNMKLSQLKQMLWKDWQKSSENPLNQRLAASWWGLKDNGKVQDLVAQWQCWWIWCNAKY